MLLIALRTWSAEAASAPEPAQRLAGVARWYGGGQPRALALIESDGRSTLFGIGDRLAQGGLLKRIEADRVVIEDQHGIRTLQLQAGQSKVADPAAATWRTTRPARALLAVEKAPRAPPPDRDGLLPEPDPNAN